MSAIAVLMPCFIGGVLCAMFTLFAWIDRDTFPNIARWIFTTLLLVCITGLGWTIHSGSMEYRIKNTLYVEPQLSTLPGGDRIYILSFYDDRGNIIIKRLDYLPPENAKVQVSVFDTKCSYAGLYWEHPERTYKIEGNVKGEQDGRIN